MIFKQQKFSLDVLLIICLIFCQFQSGTFYERVALQKSTYFQYPQKCTSQQKVNWKLVDFDSIGFRHASLTVNQYVSAICIFSEFCNRWGKAVLLAQYQKEKVEFFYFITIICDKIINDIAFPSRQLSNHQKLKDQHASLTY